MRKLIMVCLAAASAFACVSVASATTHYVSPTGDGSAPTESFAKGYSTIEAALAKAANGDTVELSEGTFETVSDELRVTNAVTVVGQGADKTIVKAVNANSTKKSGSQIYRRCFFVNNAGAFVKNLTMTNGFWYNYSDYQYTDYNPKNDSNGTAGGGDLVLYAGTIEGCVITGTRRTMDKTGDGGGSNGGGVWMKGGMITNCTITGCKAVYNNTETGVGGGLYQRGGLVVDSIITDNTAGQNGAGVCISGGTMRGCTISANTRITSNSVKGAVYMDGNCVVENCVITGHSGLNYAGVYLVHNNAKLRNSLICGNSGSFEGAGVYMEKGCVESCTIAGNSSVQATSGTGLYMKGGKALNNVIYGNAAGIDGDTTIADGTFTYNFTTVAIVGEGNVHGNAQFADAANGNYRLIAGSKAIDAAQASTTVTTDLDGVARPKGAASDMGCYEYVAGEGPLTVAINCPEVTTFDTTGTATFTATAGGANTNGVTYTWYFDGVQQESTSSDLTVENFGLGRHTVRVVANTSTESATVTVEDAVRASSSHAYVNPNGSNTYPYETREKGSHTVQAALDAVASFGSKPGLVTVAAGHYCPNAKWFEVTRPIRLVSEEGPEKTSLYGNDPNGASYEWRHVGRVLNVANAQAWVEGFTVSNGWWYSSAGDSGPGGMRLSAGTVTNCVFTLNRGGDLGGAIQMSGGRVVDCDIVNNYTRYNNDGANTYGGGVYMTDGTVEFCRIRGNMACIGNQNSGTGCGVWMSGGTLRDCELSGNVAKSVNVRGVGLAISGGTAERCVITNNSQAVAIVYPSTKTATVVNNGGGVWQSGGTVRNCLIAGNHAQQYGAGIYQAGGTLEYCTVAANMSESKYASGLYLNGSKAVTRYNVLSGNGVGVSSEPNCNIQYVAAAACTTNVFAGSPCGIGNIYKDPLFTDAANGDYTLGTGSPAIDIVDDASVEVDLAGNIRPKDNKGDGVALNDLGCYEAPDASEMPLSCGLAPLETTGHDSVTVTFTASVSGKGSKGTLHYIWDFGDGAPTSGSTDAPSVTVIFSSYGEHAVTLKVRTEDGEEAQAGVPAVVMVGASHLYVNAANAHPAWPYNTPETAATNLMTAYSTAVFQDGHAMTIDVSAGDYPVDGKWLLISAAVHLRGVDGANATFLRAVPDNTDDWARKILCVAHADALVEGFTFTGGHWQGNTMNDDGGAVRITAGTIRNCVFVDNEGGNVGGHLDMTGGLVTDCVFSNGVSYASSNTAHGQGTIYMTDGTLANSLIVNNRAVNGGGGVYMNGADIVVSNCVIHGNASGWTGYTDRSGGGVRLVKGLLTHCVITDNASNGDWGGVYQTGGTMRNCLVADNFSNTTLSEGFGLNGNSALVENCTIADNGVTNKASQVMASVTAGSVVNTVIWGAPDPMATILSVTGGTLTYSCWPKATGATNLAADPLFRRSTQGDYRLTASSPLVDKGQKLDWMTDSIDLKGDSRVRGKKPDIGCYEYTLGGLILIVK